MIYGRFTPAEQAERGDNPFIEHGGKVYRITDTAKTMTGVLNYQAEECDPREYERWKAVTAQIAEDWEAVRTAEKLANAVQQVAEQKDDDEGAAGVREPVPAGPSGPPPLAAEAERPYDSKTGWYTGLPVPEPSIPAWREPTSEERQWARLHGWKGRGPIPKAIRKAYRERDSEPAQQE